MKPFQEDWAYSYFPAPYYNAKNVSSFSFKITNGNVGEYCI